MGPMSGSERRRYIITEEDLEKVLQEYTPNLFFNFYFKEGTSTLVIEVPKQVIDKVRKYIVPHIGFGEHVVVLERGKKYNKIHKFLSRFRGSPYESQTS